MTKIKFADDREGRELAYRDIEVGKYLYNTETGELSLVAKLEVFGSPVYGVLDLNAEDENSHDTSYLLVSLKESLLEGKLKGKYLPVDIKKTIVNTEFAVTEGRETPEEYEATMGDVFYHPVSDELLMLVYYKMEEPMWDLVSLNTGQNTKASDSVAYTLAIYSWDMDTVFDEIATLVNDRIILPVSHLEIKYALK